MLNKFIGIGNLTQNPKLKEFGNNKSVCAFSVAINLNKDDKKPLFIDVQCWDKIAVNCNKFLKKGRKVFVEGKLQVNSWKTQSGENRTKIFCKADVVTFLPNGANQETNQQQNEEQPKNNTNLNIEEDEELANIPF
jgi:single-strand DNA-binding protein